jgi:hypothetical protein
MNESPIQHAQDQAASATRRIAADDFLELKQWLESDPDVPQGKWYKRFKTGTLAGRGETPSTFLTPGMTVEGEEVE